MHALLTAFHMSVGSAVDWGASSPLAAGTHCEEHQCLLAALLASLRLIGRDTNGLLGSFEALLIEHVLLKMRQLGLRFPAHAHVAILTLQTFLLGFLDGQTFIRPPRGFRNPGQKLECFVLLS